MSELPADLKREVATYLAGLNNRARRAFYAACRAGKSIPEAMKAAQATLPNR